MRPNTIDIAARFGDHARLMIFVSVFNLENGMRKIIVLASLGMIMFANSVNADLSINAFKQLSAGSDNDKATIEMYVGGVAKGFLHSNAYLKASKQSQIFCFSGDIGTGKAYQLADQAINEHLSKSPGDGKEEIVELLLLMKLKSLYPC